MIVNIVVEGASDIGATSGIIKHCGHTVGKVVNKRGKGNLDPDIPKYAMAAEWQPWVIFRDSDNECPVELQSRLMQKVGNPPKTFALRIAHTMTEAWLMADSAGFSSFFGLSESDMPHDVEQIGHAKRALLQLCAQSRSRQIRETVVASDGNVGPLYVSVLNDFASRAWDVQRASASSESLARAVRRISLFR